MNQITTTKRSGREKTSFSPPPTLGTQTKPRGNRDLDSFLDRVNGILDDYEKSKRLHATAE